MYPEMVNYAKVVLRVRAVNGFHEFELLHETITEVKGISATGAKKKVRGPEGDKSKGEPSTGDDAATFRGIGYHDRPELQEPVQGVLLYHLGYVLPFLVQPPHPVLELCHRKAVQGPSL